MEKVVVGLMMMIVEETLMAAYLIKGNFEHVTQKTAAVEPG